MQNRKPGRSSSLHQHCLLHFAESDHAIGQCRPEHCDRPPPVQPGYGGLQEHTDPKCFRGLPCAASCRVLQHLESHKLRSAFEQQRGLRPVRRCTWSSGPNNIHADELTPDSTWSTAELVVRCSW